MTQTAIVPAGECRNCGAVFGETTPSYCPQCGQDTHLHPPTVWEFFHEFVTHYVALEGRLWKTLALLFFKPGELTCRYLIGQKHRFVNPLRLYLTASILFFIVVKLFGASTLVNVQFKDDDERFAAGQAIGKEIQTELTKSLAAERPRTVTSKAMPNATLSLPTTASQVEPKATTDGKKNITLNSPVLDAIQCNNSKGCNKLRAYIANQYKNMSLREFGVIVKDRALSIAPYAMFLFLPIFAALTYLLYIRRGKYYGEHVVYAFHVHAFAYFLLLAMAFAPEWLAGLLWFCGGLYFWFAMRRVFRGRWWAVTLRYAVIGTLYPLLLLTLVILTMLVAILI